MNCSLPGSSVHGILQTRILEWVAIPFSRGSSWPRDRTHFSCTGSRFYTFWATREVHSPGLLVLFFHLQPLTSWAPTVCYTHLKVPHFINILGLSSLPRLFWSTTIVHTCMQFPFNLSTLAFSRSLFLMHTLRSAITTSITGACTWGRVGGDTWRWFRGWVLPQAPDLHTRT